MAMTTSSPTILYGDQEHDRLRMVVVFIIILGVYIGYQIMRGVFELLGDTNDYIYVLSCAGGLPIGLGISWVIEQGLKRVWHSGNCVKLDANGLQLQTRDGEDQMIEWEHHMAVTNWYFQLSGYVRGGRERRVPAKWFCLASQIRQEDERVIVYTYLPPRKAISWITEESSDIAFHEIKPRDIHTSRLRDRFVAPTRPDIPKQVLAGKDGVYWLAERRRWIEGVELTSEDFATFMQYLMEKSHV
jgi:hypothetical protein